MKEDQTTGPTSPPNVDRPITITTTLSEAQQEESRSEIERLSGIVREDPNAYNDWLTLAVYRKEIGDYEGAKEIWEYTSAIRPNAAVSLHNLAGLYAIQFSDFETAEKYYLDAIEREPTLGYLYHSAYEFYRYFKKDLSQAKKILDRGIAAADPQLASEFRTLRDSF